MAYWCDDRALLIQQRILDAEQADALRKIEAKRAQNAVVFCEMCQAHRPATHACD